MISDIRLDDDGTIRFVAPRLHFEIEGDSLFSAGFIPVDVTGKTHFRDTVLIELPAPVRGTRGTITVDPRTIGAGPAWTGLADAT